MHFASLGLSTPESSLCQQISGVDCYALCLIHRWVGHWERQGSHQLDVTKHMRNLQKKLRQIDDLEKKAAAGTSLESNQLKKISHKGELELEISALMSNLPATQLE